ncbi:MAG: DnaJ domain-containing protein [Pirellulaceae bacterium]
MDTMAQDYYQTLGLGKTASADEIQKAYRKLARPAPSRFKSRRQGCTAEIQRHTARLRYA